MMRPNPRAIQAERLTSTFRRAGVLEEGQVSNVTVESSRDTILSRIIRVRLNYSGAVGDAPRFLIYQTSHPDRVGDVLHAGRQEVAFYDQIAPMMASNIVPRCLPRATRTFGTFSCRKIISRTMRDFSTGMPGDSMSRRGTLPT